MVEKFDLDAITAWDPPRAGYVPGVADKLKPGDVFTDEWGVKRMSSGEMYPYPLEEEVCIRDESDLKSYVPPDPMAEMRYEVLRQYIRRFRGERMVTYAIIDMFEISKNLMGLQEFLIAFSQRPKLIKALFDMTTDWVIQVANKAIDVGAEMIIDVSDVAYKEGTWVRPDLMKELFVPCLKRVVDAVKKRRAYVFYHSHGNIWTLLDDLIGTGTDVIHPMAAEDRMDISIVKNIFGHKAAVAGNISTDVLTRKSREEVMELVKETMRRTSGGGGHILMASSSIYSGVNPDNYRAMVEAVHAYGKY